MPMVKNTAASSAGKDIILKKDKGIQKGNAKSAERQFRQAGRKSIAAPDAVMQITESKAMGLLI
jgi:hypothetical protein